MFHFCPWVESKIESSRPSTYAALLTLCMLGNFSFFFVVCQFVSSKLLKVLKTLSGLIYHLVVKQCGILLGLSWIQTVCKDYQQTTKITREYFFRHGRLTNPRAFIYNHTWWLSGEFANLCQPSWLENAICTKIRCLMGKYYNRECGVLRVFTS